MDQFKNYLKTLQFSGCPWKPKEYKNTKTVTLYDGYSTDIDPENMEFHPSGCCGCCVVPDDYIFGIRCDHLMWFTGEHERFGDDNGGVLLMGNHKGRLVLKFLCEEDS